jgi:hypothetical protein
LALLLSSFGAESLSQTPTEETEPNKLQEAVDRINRFIIYVKSHFTYLMKVALHRQHLTPLSQDNSTISVDTIQRYQLTDGLHKTVTATRDLNLHPDGTDSPQFCGIGMYLQNDLLS